LWPVLRVLASFLASACWGVRGARAHELPMVRPGAAQRGAGSSTPPPCSTPPTSRATSATTSASSATRCSEVAVRTGATCGAWLRTIR